MKKLLFILLFAFISLSSKADSLHNDINTIFTNISIYLPDANDESLTKDNINQSWESLPTKKISQDFKLIKLHTKLWIRIELPPSDDTRTLSLDTRRPELITMLEFNEGALIQEAIGGYMAGRKNLNIFTKIPAFNLKTNNSKTPSIIYLKIESHFFDGAILRIAKSSDAKFDMEFAKFAIYFSLGAFFILLTYQLSVFINFQQTFSIYYVTFITTLTSVVLINTGIFDYIFDNHSIFYSNRYIVFLASLVYYFLLLFTNSFLELKGILKKYILFLSYFSVLLVAIGISIIIDIHNFVRFRLFWDTSNLIILVSYLIILFCALKEKYKNSTLLVISLSLLFTWFSLFVINNLFSVNLTIFDSILANNSFLSMTITIQMTIMSLATFLRLKKINENMLEIELKARQRESLKVLMQSLSHDLGNYFFIITSNIYFVKNSFLPEGIDKKVDKIEKSVDSLNELLGTVREWLQSDSPLLSYKMVQVDLTQELRKCVDIFENKIENKDLKIEWKSPQDTVYNILADKQVLITQVLNNIMSNAIKFSPRGSIIFLSLSEEIEENIVLKIQDSGSGLSENQINEFSLTGSLISTTGTEKEKGTGFGLKLVKQAMEAFSGSVKFVNYQVENTPRGTITILTFKKYKKP